MNELEKKVAASIAKIKNAERLALALNPEDGFFLAFSGGKDSVVLYDLVQRAGVRFRAYYSVTSNDPPENIYYIRKNYPEVVFVHHKDNFFKLIEKKGLPTIMHRFCCEKLKENIGAGNVVLTGVRREESVKRSKYNEVTVYSRRKEHQNQSRVYTIEGIMEAEHQCIKGKDRVMMYPILEWTAKDVWDYISYNKLPINPCYARVGRVGCMFCPFSKRNELEMYEQMYPGYKRLFLASLQKYLDKRTWVDKSGLRTAEDYYDWWSSKMKLKRYLEFRKQTQLEIH